MKAIEFPSTLTPDGTLLVPEGVADNIPQGEPLRVLVLIPENQADKEWEQLAAIDFGQGYADSDAIYDLIKPVICCST
jgi:hypothetical protein